MKKILFTLALILFPSAPVLAQPAQLPSFNLPDPQGGMHSSTQLLAHGLVVIVSSAILKDKSAQQGWSRDLDATKGTNPASLILIEDLAASAFAGLAENAMRKDWKPGDLPILLEDKTGKVHGAFGVGHDQTMVFVYNPKGSLVFSTAEAPSVAGAKAVWGKLGK